MAWEQRVVNTRYVGDPRRVPCDLVSDESLVGQMCDLAGEERCLARA
jgi:hypothetical protein